MTTAFIKSATRTKDLPKSDRPQIALVGRSNVGKSSLLNQLTGQKNLARVSTEPGRTQTINVFDVEGQYFLIDFPGYGFAKTSKTKRQTFSDIIRDYLWQAQQLKLVLLIIDGRHGLTNLDREMLAYLDSSRIPVTMIVNKIDKLSRSEGMRLMHTLEANHPTIPLIPHSSVTGAGRGEILQAIERVI